MGRPEKPEREEFVLDWDVVAPRRPEERMRIYRVKDGGAPELIATCADVESVSTALYYLGREKEFLDYCVGWLDTFGTDEKPGEWVILPWMAKPTPEQGFDEAQP